jgi:hypothetical protein
MADGAPGPVVGHDVGPDQAGDHNEQERGDEAGARSDICGVHGGKFLIPDGLFPIQRAFDDGSRGGS